MKGVLLAVAVYLGGFEPSEFWLYGSAPGVVSVISPGHTGTRAMRVELAVPGGVAGAERYYAQPVDISASDGLLLHLRPTSQYAADILGGTHEWPGQAGLQVYLFDFQGYGENGLIALDIWRGKTGGPLTVNAWNPVFIPWSEFQTDRQHIDRTRLKGVSVHITSVGAVWTDTVQCDIDTVAAFAE